jgi:uncharacterized membrane protein
MPDRPPRLPIVDVLRGFAVAQMIVYHFIYDLNYFGWIRIKMLSDQPWVGWRTAIVTQFLLLVGVGLVLRSSFRPSNRDFWRRWAQVAGAALLVSIGTAVVFGPRFVWFGILHFIAVALVLARPLVPLGRWNLALGIGVGAFGLLVSHPFFNSTPVSLIGLVTVKPRTEDYVPLLPWFGVVLFGIGLGSMWQRAKWVLPGGLQRINAAPPRLLLLLGTWALTIYLVHQPILMGGLALLRRAGP